MTALQNWHVYVGTEVGLLKGVDTTKEAFTNLNPIDGLEKEEEITAMCWGDASERVVCAGLKNQVVKVFDSETRSFPAPRHYPTGEGAIRGLCYFDGCLVTASESGIVKLWNKDNEQDAEINTGGNLCKMAPNSFTNFQVATGGNENDLKVWDLKSPDSPIFQARNVKNDFLDLRVPVWIQDLAFKTNDTIVTCTRHHQIRLYDTRAQKRPVIDMPFERYPLMSLSLAHNDNQLVVGSSRGRMALVDLRKKLLVHVFKGFAGSIRSVKCHPTLPLVASCGLDRFLRIHDLNRHKLLKKVYLKTRLNCLLFRTDVDNLAVEDKPKPNKPKEAKMAVDDEAENLWSSMSLVKEGKKKRALNNDAPKPVKKKKVIEMSAAD
ncbi:hypothetical protein JTE90_015239 [Oedothorax gibbosus]|uniref:WD repeat-containing protein 74 n=1 Tax=Oedothorax gibbosus TaxID=931172 RepID=A0AAV6TZN7_9ARAC|nr:hypothetical protein JTE90_015239 [Oedothorax gibbosus]